MKETDNREVQRIKEVKLPKNEINEVLGEEYVEQYKKVFISTGRN